MAIGDKASAAGYDLVPDSGENGRVRWGAREINRTRDYLADVWELIPKTKLEHQQASGISYGTDDPSGGSDGDIYLKIL